MNLRANRRLHAQPCRKTPKVLYHASESTTLLKMANPPRTLPPSQRNEKILGIQSPSKGIQVNRPSKGMYMKAKPCQALGNMSGTKCQASPMAAPNVAGPHMLRPNSLVIPAMSKTTKALCVIRLLWTMMPETFRMFRSQSGKSLARKNATTARINPIIPLTMLFSNWP